MGRNNDGSIGELFVWVRRLLGGGALVVVDLLRVWSGWWVSGCVGMSVDWVDWVAGGGGMVVEVLLGMRGSDCDGVNCDKPVGFSRPEELSVAAAAAALRFSRSRRKAALKALSPG